MRSSHITLIVAGTSTLRAVPRAQTLAISVAPMPKANAPSAPCVVVWLSVPVTTMPRQHVAVLGKNLMADAALIGPDVVKLRDVLRRDEFADAPLIGGGLRALRRNAVVEDDGDARRVPHTRVVDAGALEDLAELIDDERGVLVRHGEVDARFDDLTRGHAAAAGCAREDLLGDGHAHGRLLCV